MAILSSKLFIDMDINCVTLHLTIVNTSNQNVTVVTMASRNMTVWDSYNEDCGTPYFMGFAVFLGHYTTGNISSSGTPLTLTPQGP